MGKTNNSKEKKLCSLCLTSDYLMCLCCLHTVCFFSIYMTIFCNGRGPQNAVNFNVAIGTLHITAASNTHTPRTPPAGFWRAWSDLCGSATLKAVCSYQKNGERIFGCQGLHCCVCELLQWHIEDEGRLHRPADACCQNVKQLLHTWALRM